MKYLMRMDAKLNRILGWIEEDGKAEKKRKLSLEERLETDAELKEASEYFGDLDERMVERVERGHREALARDRQNAERHAREERRRQRLRRLTFGLLPR